MRGSRLGGRREPPAFLCAFMDAIGELRERIDRFDPAVYGWEWAPQDAPCIQPELQGWRGYIEARPVRRKQGLSGARPAQEKG